MTDGRRPLASRQTRWAQAAAHWAARAGLSPNLISQASLATAALAFLALWQIDHAPRLLLILAAGLAQARLVCNLLDGMVAVEGGRGGPTGAFWNEVPDRISDALFFWGAGLAAGHPALGLGVAALAAITAYVREFGRAQGFAPDYGGPMAKPQRMAALTLACLIAAVLPGQMPLILTLMLWVVLAGAAATILRRSLRLLSQMRR